MPLYNYECEVCGSIKEYLVKKNNDVLVCSSCNRQMKQHIPDRFGLDFKGTGWARDGYSSLPSGVEPLNPETAGNVRVPIYKDRNTDQVIGTGAPEFALDSSPHSSHSSCDSSSDCSS